jgi:hypothetical protein
LTEDLTTYSEFDLSGHITKTSSRVTGENLDMDEDAYLFKDFGTNHFDGINLSFAVRALSTSDEYSSGQTGFANVEDDSYHWGPGHHIVVWFLVGGGLTIGVLDNEIYDASTTLDTDRTYYLRLVRAAGSSTVTLYIYSDEARTTLVDTLSVSTIGTTKFRYFYPLVSSDSGESGNDWDGYCENFVFAGLSCAPRAQIIGLW